MGGIFGNLTDSLFGDASPERSGAFPDTDKVGSAFSAKLLDLLSEGGVGNSQRFGELQNLLRDKVGQSARGQENELSESLLRGGAFDSGARIEGLLGIKRGEIAAISEGTVNILEFLENQTFSAVFPFLAGASQEQAGINAGRIGVRGQNIDHILTGFQNLNDAFDSVSGSFSG
jgi:hypothetical protein